MAFKTKQGEYGTLYLYAVRYRDFDPDGDRGTTRIWAYSAEDAAEQFYASPDGDTGWEIVGQPTRVKANPGSRGRKRTAGRTKIGTWWDSMDSTLAIYWGAQDLEAHFRLNSAEEVLDWLKIDPARVRADKSTTFSVSMLDLTTLLRPWRGGR